MILNFSSKNQMETNLNSVSNIESFINVIQSLSVARDLHSVMTIVRRAARQFTGADGATFVLRDGKYCFYAEEDAVSPLWKGQRFPLESCISGWTMLNRQPVAIEDIYKDSRIPIDAYRPTFVKSLVMVPIRKSAPLGAIGNYWAKVRKPQESEIKILQSLADTTSLAMENLQLYSDLQAKISDLKNHNYDLSRFAWMASHDFREPLRTISTYMALLEGDAGDKFNAEEKEYIHYVEESSHRLHKLVEGLANYLNIEDREKEMTRVALSQIVEVASGKFLKIGQSSKKIHIAYFDLPEVSGNDYLLTQLFIQLFSNAIKFNRNLDIQIKIGVKESEKDWIIEVEDNGLGIEKQYLEKIFELFQRLHPQDEFAGAGVGLAICKKIVGLHQGKIWAESNRGKGTRVFFTLPKFRFSDNE